MIALEIWQIFYDALRTKDQLSPFDCESKAKLMTILETALKVVNCTELASRFGKHVIGLAALGSNAARVIVDSFFPIELNSMDSRTNQLHLLGMIKALICSDCFDVMLHSVKSFKKKICISVDSILVDKATPVEARINMLKCLGEMILSSLFFILKRDKNYSHPPTIRRILRCLIEVTEGYRRLSKDGNLSDMGNYSSPQIFQTLESVMLLETGAIGLIGRNVVELMGMTIPELCACKLDNYTTQCFEKDLTTFVEAICKSTGPDCSWKVRHSASVSLHWSGLITHHPHDPQHFESIINPWRIVLYFHMILLLHDSDEDVRKAAARAMHKISCHPSASLRNLELGYDHECCKDSDEALFRMLMKQIYSQCKDVEFKINQNITEFNQTLSIDTVDQRLIQNLSTERPIFEEEDRNTFEEVSGNFGEEKSLW